MGVENMTYKSPIHTLIESLFRSYPYMDLSQRLMIIIAMARALDDSMDINAGEIISKARELEMLMQIHVSMYKEGELEYLEIPNELKRLYDIENKLLSKIFGFYLRPSKGGVSKYV